MNDDELKLKEVSGNVVIRDNRLAAFLYFLMRDHMTVGEVEKLVQQVKLSTGDCQYTNGWLAEYAVYLSTRLERTKEPSDTLLKKFGDDTVVSATANPDVGSNFVSGLLGKNKEPDIKEAMNESLEAINAMAKNGSISEEERVSLIKELQDVEE